MIRCEYEDKEFAEKEFSASGEHLGKQPRHLLTGDLITDTPGGNAPMDVRAPD